MWDCSLQFGRLLQRVARVERRRYSPGQFVPPERRAAYCDIDPESGQSPTSNRSAADELGYPPCTGIGDDIT